MSSKTLSDREVKPNQVWRHYKGCQYIVLILAIEEATKKKMVVYVDTSVSSVPWVRSLSSFLEVVSSDEGTNFYRFEHLRDLPEHTLI